MQSVDGSGKFFDRSTVSNVSIYIFNHCSCNCVLSLSRTGLIYDSRMLKHRNEFNPNHPEVPERISVAWDNLETKGLKQQCKILESREATKEEILLVHE